MELHYPHEEIIKTFSNLHGASGFEQDIRNQFISYLKEFGLDPYIDGLGNVMTKISSAKTKKTVLIMAHMDEVAFLVHSIDKQGFIKAVPLGRWVEQILWDKEWIIKQGNTSYVALSGVDPPHAISTALKRKRQLSMDRLFFDTGFSRSQLIELGIRPGLPITPSTQFKTFGNNSYFMGKAFDDRVGLALIIQLINRIILEPELFTHFNLEFAATVQEEVGRRGSRILYPFLKPDIVINLEASVAQDYPEQFSKTHCINLGDGPSLFTFDGSMIPDQDLLTHIAQIAQKNIIPIQWEVESSYGEDASCIQKSGHGVPAINIGIPIRYIHSHHSVMARKDFESCLSLLTTILSNDY